MESRELEPGPEVIKLLHAHSVEHEILNAHKDKNIKKFLFLAQINLGCYFPTHKC